MNALRRRHLPVYLAAHWRAGWALTSTALLTTPARALQPDLNPALDPELNPAPDAAAARAGLRLDRRQSRAFVQWFTRIAQEQLRQPTPRWLQRDCAGLVRFAAAESLRPHDAAWLRANGIRPPVPPELDLTAAQQQALRHQWVQADGGTSAYASALALAQHNSRPVSRDVNLAQPADLLFFDQGDDQHLMICLGERVVYHTGQDARDLPAGDSGMRSQRMGALLRWRDTRWRPEPGNPNFAGVFRLDFLT